MRIAVVTTSYPRDDNDPSGHFVRAEVRALERQGHKVTVLAARGPAFGWPGLATRVRQNPLRGAVAARELARLRRALAVVPTDRIVAHWSIPTGLVARGLGEVELVSHGADVRLLCALPRPVRAIVVRALCNDASTWRFVSSALLSDLLTTLGAGEARALERMAVVRASPIEMPDRTTLPHVARRGAGRLAVAVGRLVRGKRFDRVIDHLATTPNTALVVVGEGPERARLERYAAARGVDIRFLGLLPRSRALAWIAAADVLVHASEAEGMSTVLREADALGTPVVLL